MSKSHRFSILLLALPFLTLSGCVQEGDSADDNYVANYPCDNMGSGKTHDHDGERARDSFIVVIDAE